MNTLILKKILFTVATVLLPLLCAGAGLRAQTIVLDSISPHVICATTETYAYFTVTGSFDSTNTFTLQESDQFGNFPSFTVRGSLAGNKSGIIAVSPPYPQAEYRVRIASTKPPVISNSLKYNIQVIPLPPLEITTVPPYIPQDTVLQLSTTAGQRDYAWLIFSPGIDTLTGTKARDIRLRCRTTGTKTVAASFTPNDTLCPRLTVSASFKVMSCRPKIPANAQILDTAAKPNGRGVYWVQSGVLYNIRTNAIDTVYAEPGSRIAFGRTSLNNTVVYAPKGVTVTGGSSPLNVVVCSDTVLGGTSAYVMKCPGMTFDSSAVKGAVNDDQSADLAVSVFPNPASDAITVSTGTYTARSIALVNAVGQVVRRVQPAGTRETINTQPLAPGLYYTRIILRNGRVLTRSVMIVK